MENKLLVLAGALSAHAAVTKNEELKEVSVTSISALEIKKETDLVVYSKILTSEAEKIKIILQSEYGVTESEIEDIRTTTTEFKSLVGNTRPEQSSINAVKKDIDDHVKEGKYLLNDILDKLMIRY